MVKYGIIPDFCLFALQNISARCLMAAKNELFVSKDKNQFSGNDNNQYSNLNLNQKYKHPILIPVHSCSKTFNDKIFGKNNCCSPSKNKNRDDAYNKKQGLQQKLKDSDNREVNEKPQKWKKSSKFVNSGTSCIRAEKSKKLQKNCSVTNSSSTLSLLISAYENSIEAVASDKFSGKINGWMKKDKPGFISTLVIQNPFEFPRQQNDKVFEPEISQYKASQRLLNPNEALKDDRQGLKNSNSIMEIDDSPSTVFLSTFDYSDSDTSLHYIQNETEVLCCINGPSELPMSKRINDRIAVSVLYYLENGASTSSNELQEFANLMIDRSSHPRAGVSINVLQMRNNGSRLSTALNAVSLALLDTAIPFDVLFAGVEVALLSDNSIAVNPTKIVEDKAIATALVVFSLNDNELKVCGFRSHGTMTSDFYCGAAEAAKSAAKEVFDYFRKTMNARLLNTSTL